MTTKNNRGNIEEQAPELIRNLKWILVHGWRHRGLVALALIIVLTPYLWKLYQDQRPSNSSQREEPPKAGPRTALTEHNSGQEPGAQKPSQEDEPVRGSIELEQIDEIDTIHDKAAHNAPSLPRLESPDEILSDIARTLNADQTRDRYKGKRIPEPGWTGKVFGLPSRSGQGWFFTIKHDSADGTESVRLTKLFTNQNAGALSPEVRVRVTGRIREASILGITLEEVRFEIVER